MLEELAAWSPCLLPIFWEQDPPASFAIPEECLFEYVKLKCVQLPTVFVNDRLMASIKSQTVSRQLQMILFQDAQGYASKGVLLH